jgi:TonB-linked SusC/RagA family outer membrane protein
MKKIYCFSGRNVMPFPPKILLSMKLTLLLFTLSLANCFAGVNSQGSTIEKAILQQVKVTGNITDATTGDPLPGVYIRIEGTTAGAVSDVDGNYSVDVPQAGAVLQFSFIGYNTENIAVEGRSVIDVKLISELTALEEVVVVGYGTQSKRTVTGSIQSVSSDELTDMPVTTTAQKLQGKLSGVQISQSTGRPGEGMVVRIRGQASLNAGIEPLYVVDGFPIIGDISSINPNEIENISVLKDASSTALYGSRAANGVIMVTTKKAKAGRSGLSLNAYYGWQQVPQKGRIELMNGQEFAQFQKESYEDRGVPVPTLFANPAEYGEGWSMYDKIMRNAPIQDYSLSLNTGNESVSTSAVLGYFNQQGVIINSDYQRFSFRLNSDFKVNDRIKSGINIAPTYSIRNAVGSDGIFWAGGGVNQALISWPIFNYENEDGTLPILLAPLSLTNSLNRRPQANLYRSIQERSDETRDMRLLSNAYLQISLIDGLALKSSINFDYLSSSRIKKTPSTSSGNPPPGDPMSMFSSRRYYSWTNENILTYVKSIGNHNIDLLGGFSMQKFSEDRNQIAFGQYSDDRTPTIEGAASIYRTGNPFFGSPDGSNNGIDKWSMMSYIGRVNYNYSNRYLFSAAIRADGSSRFGKDDRWAAFPSVSVGWIASEEGFMKGISTISLLKLRASYGVVGNNNIGNYRQYAQVSSGSGYNAIFGGTLGNGLGVSSLSNSLLTWEQTAEWDFGFDIGLFKNRINAGYDFYNRTTQSLLYQVNVAQESGFQNFWGNVGELQFWGHEITVNSRNLVGSFKWSTDFNISFTDNKVNALTGITNVIYDNAATPSHITKVGQKIGLLYGLETDGFYTAADMADPLVPKSAGAAPGVIKFKDLSNDGVITYGGQDDDCTVIGDPTPKFTLGMTNNLSYKNFDLSIVMSGAFGMDILRRYEQGVTNLDGDFNVLKEVKDRWRSESNPGAGKYGTTVTSTNMERDWMNSRFVSNASYLAIKNVTLGYTIPKNVIKYLNNLRVYVSVQQLYTFTNYEGVNPEVATTTFGTPATVLDLGNDFGAYPVPRTISFGLNLGL